MTKNFIIRVYGRVQGVGFRYFTRKVAGETGVSGYVNNEYDGSVYIEAEGSEEQLELFISRVRMGPPRANVTDIRIYEGQLMNYPLFRIR